MRHRKLYAGGAAFSLYLIAMGLLLDDPRDILPGLWTILSSQDVLITDYMALAGPGAAFVNAGLVTLVSLGILFLAKEPINGYTIVELGLMSGFALFGKNLLNIWPILLGTWLFSRLKRTPFREFSGVALLATALSPLVSFAGLNTGWNNPLLGLVLGILVGFVIVPLSVYTYRIQNGMNLYNMGFACGLLAMVIVPILTALGHSPTPANYWAAGYDLPLSLMLGGLCLVLMIAAFLTERRGVLGRYRVLIGTSGRAPSDYLRIFGPGATMLNMGINGLVATAFILLTGGDLNGPTVGGILAIMGFSAFGKHVGNILPVMTGVLLGSMIMRFSINDPAVQLAALLCTTLAPISGFFGWPFGLAAGFLHSALVLQAGSVAEGINLYNNGFSGGLLAIVLYPLISSLAFHRSARLQDEDYLELFRHDAPLPTKSVEKHAEDVPMEH